MFYCCLLQSMHYARDNFLVIRVYFSKLVYLDKRLNVVDFTENIFARFLVHGTNVLDLVALLEVIKSVKELIESANSLQVKQRSRRHDS